MDDEASESGRLNNRPVLESGYPTNLGHQTNQVLPVSEALKLKRVSRKLPARVLLVCLHFLVLHGTH